jgi:hypothetical protein
VIAKVPAFVSVRSRVGGSNTARWQERLVADNPVRYHAIIAESALRHADREQLPHINHVGLLSCMPETPRSATPGTPVDHFRSVSVV